MARFRVIAARVIEGDKAAMVYDVGLVLDDAEDPRGHIPRLDASGALERLPDEPAAPPEPPPVEEPARARRGRGER